MTRRKLNSDINVTPFVDVMLVLLIIFMIASPMLVTGIDVDLPKSKGISPETDEPIIVSVDEAGKFYLENTVFNPEELKDKLIAILNYKNNAKIFIEGDKGAKYGQVIQLFAVVKSIGYDKVFLVTEDE